MSELTDDERAAEAIRAALFARKNSRTQACGGEHVYITGRSTCPMCGDDL